MHRQKMIEIGAGPLRRWLGALLVCTLVLLTFGAGCGRSRCDWPEGGGYVTPATNRPDAPHDVKKTSTVAEIEGVDGRQLMLGEKTEMEYRKSQALLIFPGAKITYSCKSPEKYKMEDYNGDVCVLPCGITVRIDEYGQFVPIRFKPE